MAHLLSESKDFAFIHIPKNGGSTVIGQFGGFDDFDGQSFHGVGFHHVLGEIFYGHVPLWVIERYFPREFAHISNTWACVVTREPLARFRSAMAQRSRQFLGRSIQELSSAELKQESEKIMRHLEANDSLPAVEFSHFIRQIDFVEHDGQRIVTNIFPLEELDSLIAELAIKTGVEPLQQARNRTEYTRFGYVGELACNAWEFFGPGIPKKMKNLIRDKVRPIIMSSGNSIDHLEIMDDQLLNFVNEYYARDFELHRQSLEAIASKSNYS